MLVFDMDSFYNFRKSLILLWQQTLNAYKREPSDENIEIIVLAQLADIEIEKCFYQKAAGIIAGISSEMLGEQEGKDEIKNNRIILGLALLILKNVKLNDQLDTELFDSASKEQDDKTGHHNNAEIICVLKELKSIMKVYSELGAGK